MSTPAPITRRDSIRIAAEADTDPRTVYRYFAGEQLFVRTRERVVEALRKLGIPDPHAPAPEPTDAAKVA
jgi:AcrR family transcriptional regulator